MASTTPQHQRPELAARLGAPRTRVTIELGRHHAALLAAARAQQMSVAAVVRVILAEWKPICSADAADRESQGVEPDASGLSPKKGRYVTMGLYLPAVVVAQLTQAARAAELPRSSYVMRLLETRPPGPAAPDQHESRAALMRSTATLAALSSDLHALTRALRQSTSAEPAVYRATIAQLSDAVQQHLVMAASLMAALRPYRRSGGGE